jgi:hypothetical protein
MAEQKKKTTRKPKETIPDPWMTCEYKGKTYEVMEVNDINVKLTDGTIHFWVRRSDVEVG